MWSYTFHYFVCFFFQLKVGMLLSLCMLHVVINEPHYLLSFSLSLSVSLCLARTCVPKMCFWIAHNIFEWLYPGLCASLCHQYSIHQQRNEIVTVWRSVTVIELLTFWTLHTLVHFIQDFCTITCSQLHLSLKLQCSWGTCNHVYDNGSVKTKT